MDQSKINKTIFLAAFVIGSVAMAWLRWSSWQSANDYLWWLSFVAPNLLIVIYFAYLAVQAPAKFSPSDADNLYYLGFLYTVVSLGVALVLYGKGGSSGSIMESFGVALSTTVCGLVARTLLASHAVDIEEQDQHARIQLYTATDEFIHALTSSTEKLKCVFDENTAKLSDAFAIASDTISKKLPDESNILVREIASFRSRLAESLAQTINELKKFPDALKQATERIDIEHSELLKQNMAAFTDASRNFMALLVENNKNISTLGTAIGRLSVKVEEVKVPEELISSHVERVYSIYSSAAAQGANQFQESSAAFVAALNQYSKATAELLQRLRAFSDLDGSTLTGTVVQVLEPLRSVTQELAVAAGDTRSAGESLSAVGSRFDDSVRRLSALMEDANSLAPSALSSKIDDVTGERG